MKPLLKNRGQRVDGFGSLVRRHRMELGYSLRQFASRMGVSPGYLSRIENGKEKPPAVSRIRRMADLFGIDQDTLLSASGKVDPELVRFICAVPAMPEFLRYARARGWGSEEVYSLMDAL